VTGNLDQVAIQLTIVPFSEDVVQFVVAQSKAAFHQVVRLGDQLHDSVFDPVVNHLDVVARGAGAQPGDAWLAIHVGRYGLEYRPHAFIGRCGPARHDARATTCAFLAAGDSHAEELDAFGGEGAGAHVGVREVGIACIDDEVSPVKEREHVTDHRVHRRAGRNEHHHCPRLVEQADELLDVRRAANVSLPGFLAQGFDLGCVRVISCHREAMVGHVQHYIAAHDVQAYHAYFAVLQSGRGHRVSVHVQFRISGMS
jgi:hypothetical protein